MNDTIHRWFAEHPGSVGETYTEHFRVAFSFSMWLFYGAFACLVHAVFPAFYKRTGSATVKRLHAVMMARQPASTRAAYQEPAWRPEYEI